MSKAAAAKVEPVAEVVAIEPLDSRIATVLGSSEEFSSEFLLALYNELDEAVGVADQTARECRARSIDPLCRDGIAERGRAEDQEFISHRLKAAATPLREKCQQVLASEKAAQWHHTATVVEKVVDVFHAELVELDKRAYAALVEYNSAKKAITEPLVENQGL